METTRGLELPGFWKAMPSRDPEEDKVTDSTRREFLAGAVGVLATTAGARILPGGRATYDLVVAGGTVYDPASGLAGRRDVGITAGRIAAVAEEIAADDAARVVSAAGMIVTPGLIDIHVHVYPGVPTLGIDPDLVGIARGVTTVVDAGSSGATNFQGFRTTSRVPPVPACTLF